ncbi:MAG TPA: hypothetical protein VGH87_10700 [Polyangiaceae bacterium]
METVRTKNDLGAALVRFCVAIEEHRRTAEGRVRTPAQFLEHFFAVTNGAAKDEVFRHMPKEVRGPILSGWGIRGAKAALRDEDDKVATVVLDALAAGDLDADAFEAALAPDKLLAWVPLASFWAFWRAGAINKPAMLRAFTKAYELKLLDAKAFVDDLKARGGEVTGTDVLGGSLTKDDLIEWVRKVHASGDGSAKGLVEALGWEKIVAKAPTEALLGALDALAVRLGIADAQMQTATAENAALKPIPPPEEEDPASKTDPPPPDEEVVMQAQGSITDLAKTGPYTSPMPIRPQADEEDDSAEETKLYRQRPLRR